MSERKPYNIDQTEAVILIKNAVSNKNHPVSLQLRKVKDILDCMKASDMT